MSPIPTKQRVPRLNYECASPKHFSFHTSTHAITAAIGAVGSGKTYMACAELLSQLMKLRGKTALVVGRTHSHVRDQLMPIFETLLFHQDAKGRQLGFLQTEVRIIRSSPMVIYLPNGNKLLFWSLEAGKSLKGLNVTHGLVDEVVDMDEGDFNDCFDRLSREGIPGRMWCMGNVGNKFHWFYKRYWAEYEQYGNRPENRAHCVPLTYRDNPHTKHKWADWEKQYSYSTIERQRKLEGLWVNTEGMVFPQWDPDKHVFQRNEVNIGLEWEIYGGLDFGYKDPTAGLRIARDPNGFFYLYAEYYKSGSEHTGIKEHAEWFLKQNFTGERIIKVYSDTHLDTVATYRRAGLTNIHPVQKNPGSIKAGIALMAQLLTDGRFKVCADAVNFIAEIETYEWSPTKDAPKPGKGDHALDAARYVINELLQGSPFIVTSAAAVPLTNVPVRSVPDKAPEPEKNVFAYEYKDGKIVPIYLA